MPEKHEFDAFIAHASEHKERIARPLAIALEERDIRVWLDEGEIKVGDSIRQKIDDGLVRARFGVVIFSPEFNQKPWTNHELNGLVEKEMDGTKVILPIWHKISRKEMLEFSPSLTDKLALDTSTLTLDQIADSLTEVIRGQRPPVDSRPESEKIPAVLKPSNYSLVPYEDLVTYARHPTGMKKGAEKAEEFANAYRDRITLAEFDLYRTVYHFAALQSGLNLTGPAAESFADEWIEEERGLNEFYAFQDMFWFAHAKDGMRKGWEAAMDFAEEWVEKFMSLDRERFKKLFKTASVDLKRPLYEAEIFAFEQLE